MIANPLIAVEKLDVGLDEEVEAYGDRERDHQQIDLACPYGDSADGEPRNGRK
jgi:hypothetical protein